MTIAAERDALLRAKEDDVTKVERKVLAEARRYGQVVRLRRLPGDAQLPWSEWSEARDRLDAACEVLIRSEETSAKAAV